MEITVRLDVMLARRKMKSKDLARTIGLSVQNLSLLKSGKVKGVRFDTLARICAALDCQPGDILEATSGTLSGGHEGAKKNPVAPSGGIAPASKAVIRGEPR